MNDKIIYIKQDEEITSVIDRLIRTREREVFLVIPSSAVIIQSIVNLKLLRREADNLGKSVTIVSEDPIVQRLAKKTEFLVSSSLQDIQPRLEQQTEKEDSAVLKDELTENEFKEFLKEERRPGARMVDIVRPGNQPSQNVTVRKIKVSTDEPQKSVVPPEEIFSEDLRKAAKAKPAPQKIDWQTKLDEPPKKPEFLAPEYELPISSQVQDNGWETLKPRQLSQQAVKSKENSLSSFSVKIFGIFIASAIVIAGLVFYLVLPKAEIQLTAKRETANIELAASGDKNTTQVDAVTAVFPVRPVKLEDSQSGDFPATGEKQLNEKARGIITVYNAYSSSPQALVETTRFLSTDGKIFRLTKTVTIPGAKIEEGKIVPSSIDVEAEADLPGSLYNIGPSDFSIPGLKGTPKYTTFFGKSKAAMSGGSTEKVKIITQEDFDKAKDKIWNDLQSKINQEIASQIPSQFKLLDKAMQVQISETKSTVAVGSPADNFTLTIKATGKGLIFSEDDISKMVQAKLSSQASDNKELVSQMNFEYSDIKADFDKGSLGFKVQGSQDVVWKVNTDDIKKLIAGKSENEVRQILSQRPEIKEAKFSLWPFWLKTIPSQHDKIKITVD